MFKTRDERVAHLLRKFGWGASEREMGKYAGQTEKQVLDSLLACTAEPQPPATRWAFREKEDAAPFAFQFRMAWIYEILTSTNPLRQKLSVFWHDHFSVGDNKVEDGVMMNQYASLLREDPAGRYDGILRRVVQSPAFLKYLDVSLTSKTKPNENFARELLELYTLGIGNYTELDVKETARALTGWMWVNRYYEVEGTHREKMAKMMEQGEQFSVFCIAPAAHDSSPKTILGRTANFDGDQLLDFLALRPETARFICRKLWDRFVAPEPSGEVVEDLAKVFIKTKGSIRDVLRRVTERPEFWSEQAVGRVKSPLEVAIGMDRALGLDAAMKSLIKIDDPYSKPLPELVTQNIGVTSYFIGLMGMEIFYPPDVAGWKWHEGWISSTTILQRSAYKGVAQWRQEKKDYWVPDIGLKPTLAQVLKIAEPTDAADALFKVHGLTPSEATRAAVIEHFTKTNWKAARADERAGGWLWTLATGLMAASPEYQLT